jgi:hypothetical protein
MSVALETSANDDSLSNIPMISSWVVDDSLAKPVFFFFFATYFADFVLVKL